MSESANSADRSSDAPPNPALAFLRRYVFTCENAWVVLICLMLILIFVLGTAGVQPKFIYGNF